MLVVSALLGIALGPARYASPDSATYLSAAAHLAGGHGYVTSSLDEHGQFAAVSCFAPLFPVLIAVWSALTRALPAEAMVDTVLGSYVLYAAACYCMLRTLLPPPWRRAASALALCIVCLPGSTLCVRAALSDLLGAALVLFACAALFNAESRRAYWVSGALFAVAMLARWSNLYFALAALLVLVARSWGASRGARPAIAFGTCTAALVAPVWVRNWLLTETPMGPRPSAPSSPLLHAERALTGIADAMSGPGSSPLAHGCVALLLVTLCTTIVSAGLRGRRDKASQCALFMVLSYAALLVLSSSTTQFDALTHPRFWLPVVPLLVGLAARSLASLQALPRARQALLMASALMLAQGAVGTVSGLARAPYRERSGLFAPRFLASPVVRRALQLADEGRCELAATHAFWLFPQLGTRPVRWLGEADLRARAATDREAATSAIQCVLLLRETVEYNTDLSLFQGRMQTLSQSARAELLMQDVLAELWLSQPRVFASSLARGTARFDRAPEGALQRVRPPPLAAGEAVLRSRASTFVK